MSDEELIAAIEQGDRSVGDQLYDRLIRSVDLTLYRTLGGRDSDHDDLAQAAFEQIVTTLANRRFAKACSLKSWATAITCNVALNVLRSRRYERRLFDGGTEAQAAGEEVVDDHDLEATAVTRREFERVRRHLAKMNPERAEALLLHDMFGREISEISVLLGISVAAAQSRLVRGRKELQRRLLEEPATTGEDR